MVSPLSAVAKGVFTNCTADNPGCTFLFCCDIIIQKTNKKINQIFKERVFIIVEYIKYDNSYEEEVIKVFTEGFENYPLFYNIFEDSFKTKQKFLECYKKIIKGIFKATVRKDACYVGLKDGQVASAVILESPDNKPVSVWDYIVCGMPGIIMRLGIKNTFKYLDLSERTEDVVKSIKEPHWHLYFLVVDPKLQGKGIGSDAIRNLVVPLVKKNNGKMITVTTNSERNVSFYLNNGFSIVEEETIEYNEKPLHFLF